MSAEQTKTCKTCSHMGNEKCNLNNLKVKQEDTCSEYVYITDILYEFNKCRSRHTETQWDRYNAGKWTTYTPLIRVNKT